MSIIENLNRIKSCKESIKQAIINKGVDMEGIAFEGYADKINEISGGSTPEVDDTDYVDISNWLGGSVNMASATLIFGEPSLYNDEMAQTIMGEGRYLALEICTGVPEEIWSGEYTPSVNEGMGMQGEFVRGYGSEIWGVEGQDWGTCWMTVSNGITTAERVYDGIVKIIVNGENLIVKIKSSVVNAKAVCPISSIPFVVIDTGYKDDGDTPSDTPTDFDYLTYRQNMTSYSNDDPNCVPSDYAFCGCLNLQTVDLPNSMGFGTGCFKNCGNLSSVNIPNVFAVADQGFENCGNLTEIDLPNAINIGTGAFQNCNNLQTVNAGNCEMIATNAFSGCAGMLGVAFYNCKRIEASAFQNCNNLISVNIPNCTFIGDYSFAWDNSLQELIAAEIKTIGFCAFESCNLPSIDIPKCTQIGDNAFSQNYSLTSVNAQNCGRIGQNAFSDCNMLTTLDLRNIYFCNLAGMEVFNNTPLMNGEGTIYVNAASLDKYKTHWAWSAFADRFVGVGDPDVVLLAFEDGRVYGDTTMLFDGFVDYLGISTDMVSSLDLPNVSDMTEQTMCWTGMFQGYSNLQEVAIGKLETVYSNMFNSCFSLSTVNLPECKTVNDNAFNWCSNLTTVNLPKCEYVGNAAFGSCINLNNIDLPNCNNVGGWAFQDCGTLMTANLPKCMMLGANAFIGCNNMTTLTIGTETDQVCSCWEGSLPGSLTAIFVPEHLVDAYKNDWWWSQYAHKIFAVGTDTVLE